MIINTLRQTPYQLIALTKLLNNKQNAILITDGVGVGKTISAGYIASYFSKTPSGPIIVACPNILVDKWREELITKFVVGLNSPMTKFATMLKSVMVEMVTVINAVKETKE